MNVLKMLVELVPATQIEETKEAMEKLKNMKTEPIDLRAFTTDPTLSTQVW